MRLYKSRKNGESLWKGLERDFEALIKSVIIVAFAAPFSWLACAFWYFVLYRHDIHLDPKMEVIATSSWIPMCGVVYGFFAAAILTKVFDEYKSMRMSIKAYDFDVFMQLRDEDLSPLMHALMSILGLIVLGGFMLLDYPDEKDGLLLIGSTAFILAFIFFVIREIDDPLGGVWFIKTVHEEWLNADVKEWRAARCATSRKEFMEVVAQIKEIKKE